MCLVVNRIAISRLTEFDFGNFIPKKSQNGNNNVQYVQKMEILMHLQMVTYLVPQGLK